MRSFIALLASLALAVHGAVLPSAETDGVPGYGIDALTWEITLSSGSKVSLNGTLEQVAFQLDELDPGWADKAEARDVGMSPIKRTVFNYNDVRCGTFGVTTSPNSVIGGIRYLRGVGGKPTNGPGPGNCGKVSCSNKAAIWWCNDTSAPKTLDSFGSIADGAQAIYDRCLKPSLNFGIPPVPVYNVGGQAFHGTGWNVIIRESSC